MYLLSVVDTLPHLWEGVSDVGILSSLCHSLLCLPVAPCLASLVPCQGSANQQGKLDVWKLLLWGKNVLLVCVKQLFCLLLELTSFMFIKCWLVDKHWPPCKDFQGFVGFPRCFPSPFCVLCLVLTLAASPRFSSSISCDASWPSWAAFVNSTSTSECQSVCRGCLGAVWVTYAVTATGNRLWSSCVDEKICVLVIT